MNQPNLPEYDIYRTPEKTPETVYTTKHFLFAVLSFVFGYLFIQWILSVGGGLAAFLFVLLFSIFSLTVLLVTYLPEKRRISPSVWLPLGVNAVFSLVFLFIPDRTVCTLTILFETVSYLLWYLFAIGWRGSGKIDDTLPLDAVKAVFVMPFGSFRTIFPALISPLRSKKSGKTAAYILGGIALAILPAAIVIALLSNADAAFGRMMQNIGTWLFGSNINEMLMNYYILLFSIPVAMFLFGMLYSNSEGRFEEILNGKHKANIRQAVSKLPPLVICSALIPLCLIYLLFFLSQLGYYTDAFSGLVPDGYTAAEYARSGFFQLCAVATINLLALLSASVFSAKKDGKQSLSVRVVNVILSLFTLVLIATAFRKMMLYIERYGFTEKRLLTSWFMFLLALIFILLILRQILPKFNVMTASLITFILLFGVLCFSDIDARVAQLNVAMYQNGTIESCDINSFYDLSYTAAEYVIPLLSDDNSEVAKEARDYLEAVARKIENGTYTHYSWKYYTVSLSQTAEKLSEALGEKITVK